MTLENWTKITTYYLATDEGNFRKMLATGKWEKQEGIWRSEEMWEEVRDKDGLKELEKLLDEVIKDENKELFDDCK
jgi:hypothetical protein